MHHNQVSHKTPGSLLDEQEATYQSQHLKESWRWWKQGLETWVEYRGYVWASRGRDRKVKGLIEWNLVKDMKGNKKTFCWYDGDKRKTKGNVAVSQHKL